MVEHTIPIIKADEDTENKILLVSVMTMTQSLPQYLSLIHI